MKSNLQNAKSIMKSIGVAPLDDPQKRNTQAGITLVALIITVIVLLILAMVSIRLVMNGGIIDKAEKSTQTYSEEEIGEQLKLAYSEYEMGKYSDSVDIQAKLREIYGNETTATISNGKLKATINGKTYRYNSGTGKTEGYTDPFNYGTKTKATIAPGDDITIDTEKFKVFAVTDTEIKAMPYYNLKLDSNPIKQATAETASSAGIIAFASTNYWSLEEGWNDNAVNNHLDVDMSNEANLIKQYINDYKKTLENIGVEEAVVRVAKYSELSTGGILSNVRNPSGIGYFWLGSCLTTNNKSVNYITIPGDLGTAGYDNQAGVRPIIIISK